MKKIFFPIAVAAAAVMASAAAKDPVLMTVAGKDVPLSEFVYLYEKNNKQQQQPQSVDEYLDMFINYKLKVAAAEDAGIDTTATFLRDMTASEIDLAAPYMRNKEFEDEILEMVLRNSKRNVDVSHIMLPQGDNPEDTRVLMGRLDSLRTLIVNGADFSEIAIANSIDPTVKQNAGHLGYITTNRWPYKFEKVAFETPVGQVSEVFIDEPYGMHIIKVNGERPDIGEVRVAHILKLSVPGQFGLPDTEEVRDSLDKVAKQQIDSLYRLVLEGADFTQLATENSDDPGSASRGGDVGYFTTGRMVPEFEKVSFALENGQISEPFKTSYGYHIVKRIDWRQGPDSEEMEQLVANRIKRDQALGTLIAESVLEKNRVMARAEMDEKGLAKVKTVIDKAGKLDSLTIASLKKMKTPVAKVGKAKITAAEVASVIPVQEYGAEAGYNLYVDKATQLMDNEVAKFVRKKLYEDNDDYRNLVNEYHDGNLLFEISSREVWDRSSKDTAGLEQFFKENIENYKWDKPHYKGYVVLAANDSVADLVKKMLSEQKIPGDSLQARLKERFGRDARIDRVVGGQGENTIVDYIAFGGPKPESKSFWKAWFGYDGRVIDSPEEAIDVRSRVSSDYQQYLEKEWLERLKKQYKVKVNQKVLDQIRK